MDKFVIWSNTVGVSVLVIIIISILAATFGAAVVRAIVSQLIERTREKSWHPKDVEKRRNTLVALFSNLWTITIVVIGLFSIILKLFPEVNFAPLFASAGILGVAFGFGAQSLVKDFLSGVFIISENQYRVGDVVDIQGAVGTVERIGTRSTVLRDITGDVHYFPNGMVQHVINKTMGYSMARFTIDVHPSSDIDEIIQIINKTGEKLADEEKWKKKIIEAPSFASVSEFSSSAVTLVISGKTQPSDQWTVTSEMRRRLLAAFEKSKIKL